MFKNKKFCLIAVICFCTLFISSAIAQKLSMNVSSSDLTKYSPKDTELGDYYVLDFQVPNDVKSKPLRWAFLEFYVDADAYSDDSGHSFRSIPAI